MYDYEFIPRSTKIFKEENLFEEIKPILVANNDNIDIALEKVEQYLQRYIGTIVYIHGLLITNSNGEREAIGCYKTGMVLSVGKVTYKRHPIEVLVDGGGQFATINNVYTLK